MGLVIGDEIDDTVRLAGPAIGPTSVGANTPRPPPSIIAGPPMPMFESSVAITTSQHPRIAALPAKQYPALTPTSGTVPESSREPQEREAVEAGDAARVGVARPPAATLGEEHDRQPQLLGELEQAVLLPVVAVALRAGQHRVVVRHRDRPRRATLEADRR